MIRLMFVNYTLSSVWVTEWPSFEKWLHTRLFVLIVLWSICIFFLIIIILVFRARCVF